LRGTVFEPDGIVPHASARVFVGRFDEQGKFVDVVAAVTADASGFWVATNVPAGTYDLAAVSFDGQRKGDRRNVQALVSTDNQVSITLNGRTTVSGRVEFFNGSPAPKALVAGGDTIVRTDSNGLFILTGVPTGNRTVSAGVERNPAAGLNFPRLGSAQLSVVAGVDNFVVIRLRPAGAITGRVLDAIGQKVPKARVVIPQENGFLYVDADEDGNYLFENMGLGEYTLSAPGPGVADTDTSGLVNRIRDGSEEEVLAAMQEAFRIFAGVNDPFLNGKPFNPVTWGFTRTRLAFDGQTIVADIHLLRPGTVSGIVLNGQGVPIGAKVRLTGIGPLANGAPSFVIRGEVNSDPALGTFSFPDGILVGSFGLQAASPFFPSVISISGQTTSTDPDSTNNVLQFPPTRENNGRLRGIVFDPDGSRAGSNVTVKINLSADFAIKTDTNGVFDTANPVLPAINPDGSSGRSYTVEAQDPVTGLRGFAIAIVMPGATNECNVQLIGKGNLNVSVIQASGQPATNATVNARQGVFPFDEASGQTDTNGLVVLQNIFAGSYGIQASLVANPTTIFGRANGLVTRGETSTVTIVLGPTATIRGTFLKRDLATPVASAQIAIGNLGFAVTDGAGKFLIEGIPLGTYQLVTQDPVTGVGAVTTVSLNVQGEVRDVTLVEQFRGELKGFVVDSYGNSFVPGARVTLRVDDGISPTRTVTTGPDGAFSFPGTRAGVFTLEAESPQASVRGFASGSFPENVSVFQSDVHLQPFARVEGTILEADGIIVASNATVRLFGNNISLTTDTDSGGRVRFIICRWEVMPFEQIQERRVPLTTRGRQT